MTTPPPRAGGFLLILPIVIGFFAGLLAGNAMAGVLIGTALGLCLALGLWLIDRRRDPRGPS